MGYMARQPVVLRQILFVDYINYMGYVMQADKSLIDTQTHRTRHTHKFKVTYYNTKKGRPYDLPKTVIYTTISC